MIARTMPGRFVAVALSLALSQVVVPVAQAQVVGTHLLDSRQVAASLLEGAKTRDERVKLFQEALATTEAQRQAKAMGVNAEKLRKAIPHLSDKELEDLARRAAKSKDVAAGHHDGSGLALVGVVLLLAGLLILAAVVDYDEYYEEDCFCY